MWFVDCREPLIATVRRKIAPQMTEKQRKTTLIRAGLIAVAVASVYCVGYALKVAGWRMVESNGGNAGPFPDFLPPQNFISTMVGIALSAIATFLIVRRNAAT